MIMYLMDNSLSCLLESSETTGARAEEQEAAVAVTRTHCDLAHAHDLL